MTITKRQKKELEKIQSVIWETRYNVGIKKWGIIPHKNNF